MGAVVGGLYAAGYSPDELEDLLLDIDWNDVMDDRSPRRMVPFRRKVDDLTFLTRLEIGFNGGRFQLPPALVQGQKLDFLLQSLAVHTVGVDSFDDLPIPFRTVATDLETGAEVVLDHGDLAWAIRASMSVPGVFAPVVIEDRVLVDGGLVNNLPVDLAREMGADVVIAVDVGEPLKTREELESFAKVATQVVRFGLRQNVGRQMADADIVLFPDVEEFGTADFHRAVDMIPRGEEVARDAAEDLAPYSVSEQDFAGFRSRFFHREIAEPNIVSVQVTDGSRADPDFVFARLRTRPGDPLDVHAIARDLERLHAEGDYELVTFFLTKEPGGYVLHIEAHEKSWGPHTIRFGLNMTADFEGGSDFNLRADYTMTHLNRLRGEAKFAVQIGAENILAGEFYQPLHAAGMFFVSPTLDILQTSTDTAALGGTFARFKVGLVSGGLDLGLNLRRWGELRVGLTYGTGRVRPRDGGPDVPDVDFDRSGLRARLILDQLDDPNFPRRGWFALTELFSARESLGSDEGYNRLQTAVFGAASRGRHTILGSLEHGSSLGSDLQVYEEFSLGGLFRLSGYPLGTLYGPKLDLALVSYYYQVADFGAKFMSAIYAGGSLEAGNVWQDAEVSSFDDLLWAGSLYVGMDSYIGPIYLAYGWADDGRNTWYLLLGRSF